jgi:hypothetical protein
MLSHSVLQCNNVVGSNILLWEEQKYPKDVGWKIKL